MAAFVRPQGTIVPARRDVTQLPKIQKDSGTEPRIR